MFSLDADDLDFVGDNFCLFGESSAERLSTSSDERKKYELFPDELRAGYLGAENMCV